MISILLASASPRRRQLLEQLNYSVQQVAPHINESQKQGELAEHYVIRLAEEKALAVALHGSVKPIVAADTVIHLDGQIIGKPRSFAHACEIWSLLANRKHQVLTALALHHQQNLLTALSVSEVSFTNLSERQMKSYWDSGEPQDKAGAYAIQGQAAQWIKRIKGSYSGIMGLPLYELQQLMQQVGIVCE